MKHITATFTGSALWRALPGIDHEAVQMVRGQKVVFLHGDRHPGPQLIREGTFLEYFEGKERRISGQDVKTLSANIMTAEGKIRPISASRVKPKAKLENVEYSEVDSDA